MILYLTANREAEAGFTLCAGCEFENFKRFSFCSLCGDRLPRDASEGSKRGWKAKAELHETSPYATQLKTQQIRVRYAVQWDDIDNHQAIC